MGGDIWRLLGVARDHVVVVTVTSHRPAIRSRRRTVSSVRSTRSGRFTPSQEVNLSSSQKATVRFDSASTQRFGG